MDRRHKLQKINGHLLKNQNSKNKNNNSINKTTYEYQINNGNQQWVPEKGPVIKKKLKRCGFKVACRNGSYLRNLLCKNKDLNSYPGCYQLNFSGAAVYNGETKKKNVLTR